MENLISDHSDPPPPSAFDATVDLLFEDEQGLFFGQSAFSVKVILEKRNVGLRRVGLGIKLFVRRRSHRRSLYLGGKNERGVSKHE